ncbi:17986_t:CDS:2, partial [Racocetra persica]
RLLLGSDESYHDKIPETMISKGGGVNEDRNKDIHFGATNAEVNRKKNDEEHVECFMLLSGLKRRWSSLNNVGSNVLHTRVKESKVLIKDNLQPRLPGACDDLQVDEARDQIV